MTSSNIKSYLKDARDAIKNKDYQICLKTCKLILKQDKENYMGWVFLGISLQELGPTDQAEKAFQKAIEINSSNVLAWNGLLNYYEKCKNDDDSRPLLLKVYLKILELETNDKKLNDVCEKLELFKDTSENEFNDIVQGIYKTAKFLKEQNCASITPWSILVTIISERKENPFFDQHQLILEDALVELTHNTKWMTIDYFARYLKILFQRKKYDLLIDECKRMHSIYEGSVVPLEWLCKLYNVLEIEENELATRLKPIAQEYLEILEKVSSQSIMTLFTKATLLFKNGNIVEAKELLKEVTSLQSGHLHAWLLLSQCYVKLKFYEDALKSLRKMKKTLSSMKCSNDILQKTIIHLETEILSKDLSQESWENCIEICKKIAEESCDRNISVNLIRSYINLGKIREAKKELEKISDSDDFTVALLKIKIAQKEGKEEKALRLLKGFEETLSDNPEFWLETGLIYWEMQKYDQSAIPFLKSAKLYPNCYLSFLYLGHYYQKFNNLDKARKCYERSFKINNGCIEAALELNKIYRKLGNWEANLSLLQELIGDSVKDNNQWAWVQLAVSYLQQEDFERAVDTWRYLVRCEPDNSHFWEGLADAYLARGSFTSALKSYQKAAEITPNTLYPLLQIANVKRILGEHAEAKADFENILRTNEKYIPALKGLAETCLNQAKLHDKNQLLGLTRDCCQSAFAALAVAIQGRSDFSCLWKLAADCCYLVASLPEKYCHLSVPFSLFGREEGDGEESKILEKDDLYTATAKYYYKSLSLAKDNILIWHDLACCYLAHANSINEPRRVKQLCDRALAAAKHCTKENPTNWQHWNLLGNAALRKDPSNYSLAQHAFIKAVEVDEKSAVAWCNLGGLYLKLGEFKLANRAFAKAQRADIGYVNSWVGQALIAEMMGAQEAMDLFRHSTQLGLQLQGALGYGHWVCQTLLESPPHQFIYSIHKMYAIPVACDALTWYIERNPYDSCAWNMLGILRERMGLKTTSLEAFRNAYKCCIDVHKDKVKVNVGRLLFTIGRYTEAIGFYRAVEKANFKSGSGLALALFKDKQYEESYEAYESALHWLTEEQSHQSDLLVALASMAYMFQGLDAAKTLLFQSVKCEPPSAFGYYATLALSLLHQDFKLAEAVVKELNILKDKTEYLSHTAALLSYFYTLKRDSSKAICELSKLIHRHPNQASLRLSLATVLLRFQRKETRRMLAGYKCAQLAAKLGEKKVDVKKALCVISLLCLLTGNKNEATRAAQKAVHCYPDSCECWCTLAFVLSSVQNLEKDESHIAWLRKCLNHVDLLPGIPPMLERWLNNQKVLVHKD